MKYTAAHTGGSPDNLLLKYILQKCRYVLRQTFDSPTFFYAKHLFYTKNYYAKLFYDTFLRG